MMHYTGRYTTEQMAFYRQQPRSMACVPFDFEADKAVDKADAFIGIACTIGLMLTQGWLW
jgi:hypothetical protein